MSLGHGLENKNRYILDRGVATGSSEPIRFGKFAGFLELSGRFAGAAVQSI